RLIFVATASVIVLVFIAGPVTRGSHRWLHLGSFTFQPSEFGKLLFVLALAGFLAERARRIGDADTTLRTIGLGAIPIVLVFLQPDLGTALVYAAALAAVLFVAGTRWLHLSALGIAVVLLTIAVLWWLPSAGVQLVKPYQQKRITGFLNPDQDPSGATYNITQSMIAVGS